MQRKRTQGFHYVSRVIFFFSVDVSQFYREKNSVNVIVTVIIRLNILPRSLALNVSNSGIGLLK